MATPESIVPSTSLRSRQHKYAANRTTKDECSSRRVDNEDASTRAYWLLPHAYICVADGGIVVLDLEKDKYLGLAGPQAAGLCDLVNGWPRVHCDDTACGPAACNAQNTDANALAEELLGRGLLTRDPAIGKAALAVKLKSVDMLPLHAEGNGQIPIRPIHIWNFLIACVRALYALRFRSLSYVVCSLRANRSGRTNFDGEPSQETLQLVDVFRRLRVYLFSDRDRCLFHSLALVNFLEKFNHYPAWVIGVRTGPFAAHCWVQEGGVVLDGAPHYVCYYTPILAV